MIENWVDFVFNVIDPTYTEGARFWFELPD